jgi:hypothetical protein
MGAGKFTQPAQAWLRGDRDNLSKAERNALRVELAGYADDYRRSVQAKVADLKGRRRGA